MHQIYYVLYNFYGEWAQHSKHFDEKKTEMSHFTPKKKEVEQVKNWHLCV
jgi:hypothetical protein